MLQNEEKILRLLIKSALLREAPLADILPTGDISIPHEAEKYAADANVDTSINAYDRFHRTDVFRDKAKKTFQNFSIPVYIVPIKRTRNTELGRFSYGRTAFLRKEKAAELMQIAGISDYAVAFNEVQTNSACVIFSAGFGLQAGFLPTPWMIIHAMFDDADGDVASELSSEFGEIFEMVSGIPTWVLLKTMTMKSARDSKVTPGADIDVVAELIAQAIISSTGVVFKTFESDKHPKPAVDRMNDKLATLATSINSMNMRQKLESILAGKFLYIDVHVPA